MATTTEFVLQLGQPLTCHRLSLCKRMTTLALASSTGKRLEVQPRCHLHGYMEEVPGEDLRSVERFVVEEKGGGAALVMNRVSLAEVPGPYQKSTEENALVMDEAFLVAHRNEQGAVSMVYAVWISDDLQFDLYVS
jgi:hypothetical protein